MQSLSQRAVEARNALVKDGKDELANIIIEIQKNEEELLIVRLVSSSYEAKIAHFYLSNGPFYR